MADFYKKTDSYFFCGDFIVDFKGMVCLEILDHFEENDSKLTKINIHFKNGNILTKVIENEIFDDFSVRYMDYLFKEDCR